MDLPVHEGEIPIPITSTYAGAHGHTQAVLHDSPFHSSNGHFPPTTTNTEDGHHHGASCNGKKRVAVVYRECLKNHAASIGGRALDGCGEFMPGGAEGTLEALRCSACSCHRNFHRKEIEGELLHGFQRHLVMGRKSTAGQKGVLTSAADADGCYLSSNSSLFHRPSPHQMVMPLGALQRSDWPEEMEGGDGGGGTWPKAPIVKKRFRTKFTPEQKEKMLAFAEKVGWRLQREEEGAVQQLCQEIGVKRRVLKVWMHNNKNMGQVAKMSPQKLE